MKETEFFRFCTSCDKKLFYKTKESKYQADYKNTVCASCANSRGPLSEEHKKNIGKGIKNSEKWENSCVRNPEWRKKISETEKGKVVSDKTREKLSKSHVGQKVSQETKDKLRETSRKAWQDGKFDKMIQQTLSKSSQRFLDRIEDEFNMEFEREFLLNNKYFDAKYKNILIEVDSKWWHSLPEHKKNDKLKNKIAKKNGYELYRFEVNNEKEAIKIFKNNLNKLKNILN